MNRVVMNRLVAVPLLPVKIELNNRISTLQEFYWKNKKNSAVGKYDSNDQDREITEENLEETQDNWLKKEIKMRLLKWGSILLINKMQSKEK